MRKMNKTRRYRGGGLGQIFSSPGPMLVAGADTGISFTPQSSCLAEVRPGYMSNPGGGSGLPGMGGRRRGTRSKRGSKRRGSKQRGGRYGFDLSTSATFGGTPWGSGIPQVMSIPCESARSNPLNVQAGGVGGVDSAFYSAPTAGYTNTPSTWVGTTGAPSMLQTPYDARILNPACMKTGGARRKPRSRRAKKKSSSRRK